MLYVYEENILENNYDRNTKHEIAKHSWKDLIKKDWVISEENLEGKKGAPLNPQEWIEHYYRIEGAINYFEDATGS